MWGLPTRFGPGPYAVTSTLPNQPPGLSRHGSWGRQGPAHWDGSLCVWDMPYAHGHTAPLTYPVPGTRLLAALQTHPPHSHWGHRCPSLPLSGGTPDHSLYQVAAQPDLLQTTAFHDVHLCCCLLLATSSVLRGDSPQIRHLDPGGLQMKEEVPSHQAPDESRW